MVYRKCYRCQQLILLTIHIYIFIHTYHKYIYAHTHTHMYIHRYSFGMTLWELAYEKIPYKDWGIQKIQEHVTSNKREVIQRRNEPQYVNNYLKIVKESK